MDPSGHAEERAGGVGGFTSPIEEYLHWARVAASKAYAEGIEPEDAVRKYVPTPLQEEVLPTAIVTFNTAVGINHGDAPDLELAVPTTVAIAWTLKNTSKGKLSPQLTELHTKLDELAEKHLLPQFKEIDPNLRAGYTGSFKTGIVGNRSKPTFGQPIDMKKYDIDYYIESDILYEKFGNSLKANPEFRKILSETPGFEGLKPNKEGFSIKFKPSSK